MCCARASERSCGFASFAEICSVCNCEASEDVSSDVLLCGQHYRVVHRHYHPDDDVVCALCGARRKHRASVNRTWAFRPIPKPECIEALLHEIGSFEGSLTNSVVCAACYVFCALKHEDARSDELIRSELKKQIEQLTLKLNNLDHDSEVSGELALLKTSLHLGDIMLRDRAITFPQLYKHYCLLSLLSVPLPRYRVFVYIGKQYGNLMSMACRHDKIGRMLFRTNCDPFIMLSHALVTTSNQTAESSTVIQRVHSVGQYLNEKVHSLAKELIEGRMKNPVASCMFDVDSLVGMVDSHLWTFFSCLTKSAHETHVRAQSDVHSHIKRIRIAYIVCTVLFCTTDGHCSVPLHILLTDFIDACGGSTELITVLNRLGAIASSDTLNRHMCTVSLERKAKGLLKDINCSAFTIATADNIDFLQSHASVYAGSQHRSWHGTSVQVVQPQPNTLKVVGDNGTCSSERVFPPRQVLSVKRTERSSPIRSPDKGIRSPHPKRLKRARTFKESVDLNENDSCATATHASFCTRGGSTVRSTAGVDVGGFILSQNEHLMLASIKESAFTYVIQKSCLRPEHVLKQHMAAMNSHIHTVQATVVYLSIIDMHADTIEAMSEVASMLYKEYIETTSAKHLIVGGDAKTFLPLKELKQHYGSELEWLLPFIGDWHVLYV